MRVLNKVSVIKGKSTHLRHYFFLFHLHTSRRLPVLDAGFGVDADAGPTPGRLFGVPYITHYTPTFRRFHIPPIFSTSHMAHDLLAENGIPDWRSRLATVAAVIYRPRSSEGTDD